MFMATGLPVHLFRKPLKFQGISGGKKSPVNRRYGRTYMVHEFPPSRRCSGTAWAGTLLFGPRALECGCRPSYDASAMIKIGRCTRMLFRNQRFSVLAGIV